MKYTMILSRIVLWEQFKQFKANWANQCFARFTGEVDDSLDFLLLLASFLPLVLVDFVGLLSIACDTFSPFVEVDA